MSELVRLNKYLAQTGLGSRRECDAIIDTGVVEINGNSVELGQKVDPSTDIVTVRGKPVTTPKAKEYYLYHKDRGTLVTTKDTHGRQTIYDALLKKGLDAKHLKYVGRLDMDSEGALLLTNDGDLIHSVTHPRFHIKKVYRVLVDHPLTERNNHTLVEVGVKSEEETLFAGAVRFKEKTDEGNWYEVDLYEGKNRQVRRLFDGISHPVIRLQRVQFANIKLRDLPLGEFRELQEREIKGLLSKGYKQDKKRG